MRSRPAIQFVYYVVVILLAASCMNQSFAQAPIPDSPAIEQRVDAMLSRLSIEQEIDLLGGEDNMYTKAAPSIGIPRFKMSDGPLGVRTWGPSTAYAGGIALAATWDPALSKQMGSAIGQDARARGVHFLLGPAVNIYRAPMNGRNFEYFGEDPYLSGRIAVEYIKGVQDQGVVAVIKHYALNNQEWDRNSVSSDADERTMREIYLPAFEAAVTQAHVGAVMDSYNLVNGVHSTQNHYLNVDALKNDWKFKGVLMSDWDATYDAVAAANNGLDLEMPYGKFMNRTNMLAAIQDGKVASATIDDKVRRLLRVAIQFGFLDRSQNDPRASLDNQNGRQVALNQARESIVLLKNENSVLPLDPQKVHTVAILGLDAWPAVPGGGGSSIVASYSPVSLLTGLSNNDVGVKVLYASGLPTAEELFSETSFAGGVNVETFDNTSFSGKASVANISHIDSWKANVWAPALPIQLSIRYSAKFIPTKSADYLFLVAGTASDAYKLRIDGKQLVDGPPLGAQAPHWAKLFLNAGKPVSITLDYLPSAREPRVGLGIRSVDELVSDRAKAIAAQADAAIIAVGFEPSTEGEGFDRTYSLPWGQEELIQVVSKLNKKTIVTLTAGGSIATANWLNDVPVFLHNWYAGQEGGTALSEIIFGLRSPEGKLPISFDRSWEDNAVHDNYYAVGSTANPIPHVKYAEGVFLGYRYYTSSDQKPLYPFGFGLSYTKFSFTNLHVSPSTTSDDVQVITFDVTNTGSRAGADVAQLYVGDPSAVVKRPAKELKGFQKVRLEPGEKQHVTLTLNRRTLSYWDEIKHQWHADAGRFTVFVGDSSENTPLVANFDLKH